MNESGTPASLRNAYTACLRSLASCSWSAIARYPLFLIDLSHLYASVRSSQRLCRNIHDLDEFDNKTRIQRIHARFNLACDDNNSNEKDDCLAILMFCSQDR